MCSTLPHTDKKSFEKKFSLAAFFNQHWDNYIRSPKYPITPVQYKAVNAIRKCRTEALGKNIFTCNDCGQKVEVFHSCKNRFCPNCSWADTVKWSKTVYNHLLNVPHRHVVMTLPHTLNYLIRRNNQLFFHTLLAVASNLIKGFIRDKYHVEPGLISVLHTFGERKNLHLHVHMIVSWGGVDKGKNLLKSIPISDYVDYPKLKDLFREAIIKAINKAYNNDLLKHNFENKQEYKLFIASLLQTPWILHLEPPMNLPEQVIRYIGRYSKRACLSEYKITSIEGDFISFKYKDYKQKDNDQNYTEKIEKLHYYDFFPLLLQHVPLTNFRIVRYYGIYATKSKILAEFKNKEAYVESADVFNQPLDPTKICSSCSGKMTLTLSLAEKGSVLWFIQNKKSSKVQRQKIAA
jgi:hypothetical protein